MIVAGTINALAKNAANAPRIRPQPIPSASRPTKIRVIEPPTTVDMTRSTVFMETPKQRPMRKPAISARHIDNAASADRGFPHGSLLWRLYEDSASRHVYRGRRLDDSDFRRPRGTGYRLGADSRRVGSVLRQRVDCSCYDHGHVCALWHLAAVPLLGFRSQRRTRFDQPSRVVGDYLCCRIPTHRSRGALGCRRDARDHSGGAPEFCLRHGRLLLYRAPFLLALSVAAGLPPLLSARLCHLYGRSSDDFGSLGPESKYREDLARHARARLVRCVRIIGGLVGSPFLGRQGETGERSFAGRAQTY